MRRALVLSWVISLGLLGLTGCVSKDQVAKIIKENPEIVFDALSENPEKFIDVATQASNAARQKALAKRREEETKTREEEFANPKKPTLAKDRAYRGLASAPLTIVEYSDFECPYCKKGFFTVEEVIKKYGKKVRFIFKHLPLDFHRMAMPAAQRFEAIALQSADKAYKFHDEVFKNQDQLRSGGEKWLDKIAKKVGANMAKMKKDMKSEKVRSRIEADIQEAKKFGISGTPGFVVAGVTLKGAYPSSAFEEILDRRLKERGIANE